jgi:two-component system, LytTR family, response regulator
MNILITNYQPILEVQTVKGLKLITTQKIIFIKAHNKGSIIFLATSEEIQTKYLLKFYNKYLPIPYFFRCHNSYLVNCQFVDCFSRCQIFLKGNQKVPLARGRRQQFKINLIEYQLNS